MIIRVNHPDIAGNQTTYISSAASATDTTLTVQNITGFSVGEYIVVGKLGEEKTELVRIHASTAPSGSTITLASALTFDHSVNTPITYIAFNQCAVYSASTETGSYTIVGSATDLSVDEAFTEVNDSSGTTSTWYKTRYYNSSTSTWSSYSDEVSGTGYTEDSLSKIIEKANAICNDKDNRILTEDDKIDIVNDGYQQVINKLEKNDHKRFVKKGYVDVKNSYNTGTIATTDGSTTVTGTDTVWSTGWTGKKIIFADEGFPYEIASVDSTTSLTLTKAYSQDGEDLSGETYKIFQDEYDIHDESTGVEVTDFKKIEQVINEEGNAVSEYDLHRTENGYYLKRQGTDLKFCLNYHPSTSNDEGRWTVWYRYHPSKLDSMADEPEFPVGYSGILVAYLSAKIWQRIGNLDKSSFHMSEFITLQGKLIGESVPRTNKKRGFRLDRNLRRVSEHDSDWISDIYSRKTIGT